MKQNQYRPSVGSDASRRPDAINVTGRAALITIVHNENFFLPIWLRYYAQFFAADDIYVLDHDGTDGSTDTDGFVRLPVSHETVDHMWMRDTIQALQHELLARYEAVLVTDVDEIVVPDPRVGSLGEYIEHSTDDFVNCRGVEIVHVRAEEPPYEPSRAILDQRHYWKWNAWYDKPALARVPMNWIPGFHSRIDSATNPDPNLYLVHLHRLDYDACRERHRSRSELSWNQHDFEKGWALYNRIVDDREFDRWFYRDLLTPGQPPFELARVPRHWRGAL
jgi:Glycosyl transferase family 2